MNAHSPIVLERDNVNDESVVLVRWFAGHGDRVEAGKLLAEVETSKANMEVYAPGSGYLLQAFPEGAEVPVSAAIGSISPDPPLTGAEPAAATREATCSASGRKADSAAELLEARNGRDAHPDRQGAERVPEFVAQSEYRQRISPLAAKMMESHGLTPANFPGKSIVRKRDIDEFLNPREVAAKESRPRQERVASIRRTPITQSYTRTPLSKMKQREAAALSGGAAQSVSSAVTVTCFTRGLRRIVESRFASANASAVLIYETSRLLRKFPTLNATYMDGAMLQYEQVNVGFAMDDGRGLKVAVLPRSDELSLHEITERLRNLTVAYLDDKLTPEMLADATFTVSDLSGLGVSSFYPLISENQGAILGVSGEQFAPGSEHGFFTLTLTFDHQLSNGRIAALFLNDLKERLLSYEQLDAEGATGMTCARCGRGTAQLTRLGEHLLQAAQRGEKICTLCIAGY